MIHAHNMTLKIRDPDPGGHGPPFLELMNKINVSTVPDPQRPPGGYKITTTHSMIGEVENYRTHWWECERCRKVIKRSMNRPPQEADCIGRTGSRGPSCRDPNCGYHTHIRQCGGAFIKVREPDPKKPTRKKSPARKPGSRPALAPGQQRIDSVAAGAAGAAAAVAGAGAGATAGPSGRGAKRPASALAENRQGKPAPGAGASVPSGGPSGSRTSGASGSQQPTRSQQPTQPRPHHHPQQQPLERLWGQVRGTAGGSGGSGGGTDAAGGGSGAAGAPGSPGRPGSQQAGGSRRDPNFLPPSVGSFPSPKTHKP
ncbi:hypothetical protein Agub_g4597, partial [Astrephomene gubernaculifera]